MSQHPRWIRHLVIAAALFVSPLALQADTIWNKPASPGAKPFERANLKILKVEGENLVFQVISSGRQDTKPLADIHQIKMDSEPGFSAAEAAFVADDFAKATTEYQKALSSKQPWIKLRSALRMVEAASKSKNFAAAVKGYTELLKLDPAAAAKAEPEVPAGAAPGSLDAAQREARSAAEGAGISPQQKQQLQTLELKLAQANGDTKRVKELAEMLSGAPVAPPVTGGQAPAGNANADANRRIQLALVAISGKQFDQALKQINDAPGVFTTPEDQVEALYCIAEAKNGLAKDVDSLKEAGIDYMRMIARVKATSIKSPRVADALFKTAVIHERIRANDEAALLYQQVVNEAEGTELGQKASAALARLSKKEPA